MFWIPHILHTFFYLFFFKILYDPLCCFFFQFFFYICFTVWIDFCCYLFTCILTSGVFCFCFVSLIIFLSIQFCSYTQHTKVSLSKQEAYKFVQQKLDWESVKEETGPLTSCPCSFLIYFLFMFYLSLIWSDTDDFWSL